MDRIVLVDAMNVCHKHYHTKKNDKRYNRNGVFVGIIDGFLSTINIIRRKFPNHEIYVLWDSKTRIRYEIDPSYKSKPPKTVEEEKLKKREREIISRSIDDLKPLLTFDGIHQLYSEGYEADDLAAWVVNKTKDSERRHIVMWTSDSDWSQLLTDGVVWVNTKKKPYDIYTEKNFIDDNGFEPNALPLFKALTGDSSDNISGLYRFPKKQAKYICAKTNTIEGYFFQKAIFSDLPEKWSSLIDEEKSKVRSNYELAILYHNMPKVDIVKGEFDKSKYNKIKRKFFIVETSESYAVENFMKRMIDAKKKNTKEG